MGRVFDFVANSRDGVFAVDRRQSIVLWNDGARRILGYRRDEVLGKPCYRILRGRNAEGCATCRRGCEVIKTAARLDLPSNTDVLARHRQGRHVLLNVSTTVVPSRSQGLSVLVHMFREVADRQALFRAVQDLAHAVARFSTRGYAEVSAGEPPGDKSAPNLTRRERQVLGLLTTGVSTAEIATLLCVSPRTVRNHINNVLNKLGVHSRLEAVTYSIHNGLV